MSANGIHDRAPIDISGNSVDRFWAKVSKFGGGCWNWTAATRSTGYGCMKVNGRLISAHRLSFVLHFGEVPEGQIVCHRCDNRLCVRPDHLFAGTPHANVADMDAKGRRMQPRGEKSGSAKLTEADIVQFFALRKSGHSNRRIAAMFGVDSSTVNCVFTGRSWRHVTDKLKSAS